MDRLLSQAATNLSIRSEVEDTLISILHDVETAHSLQESVNAHNVFHDLKKRYTALQLRYEEREAVWELERKEKERMGMILLEEIVKLSAKGVREEKERRALEIQVQRLVVEGKRSTKDLETKETDMPKPIVEDNTQNVVPHTTDMDGSKSTNIEPQIIPDNYDNAPTTDLPKENSTTQEREKQTQAATEDQKTILHELNETTLMSIFSYSDPLDVMSFAQINKAMFSRIDALFGMGSTAVSSHQNNEHLVVPTETKAISAASNVDTSDAPGLLHPPSESEVHSSASVASATSQSIGTAPKTSPKLFSIPSPSIPSIVGPLSGPSWLSSHTRTPSQGSSGPTTVQDNDIKFNAAMANSMASKLTPAELSVILRMREKLQKCETDAARWRQEKEDAVANLESVKAVKEFLVTRVRETEKTVEKQNMDMKEVQRKNLVDQEVIVFLDERVKKLESEVGDITSKEAVARQEASDIVTRNEKKVIVLSDMLQFEREQMTSSEKEWKNTKKILVQEVKKCRSHIVTLEAELEGLRRENEHLKDGLRVLSHPKKGLKVR